VVVGGTVRLDFVTLVPDEGGSRPKTDVQHRLIMPVDGFLAAARRLAEAAEAIAKMEPRHPPAGAAAEPAPAATAAIVQSGSPSGAVSGHAVVAAAEPPAVAPRPKPPFP
jgi:hypothetical protein